MKVTAQANQHQRQSAGFAISDILELNDRASAGLDSHHDAPIYSSPQDIPPGHTTLLPPPSRPWPPQPPSDHNGKPRVSSLNMAGD